MLPTSNLAPINAPTVEGRPDPTVLADAFSEFISSAGRLERFYQKLRNEVVQLRRELEERNAALRKSLVENERIRLALQGLVGALPCGVLVLDENRDITLLNSETIRLLEIDPSRVRRLGDLAGSLQSQILTLVEGLTQSDGEQEITVATSAGKRWIAIRGRRLATGQEEERGQQHRTIVILRDISLQKELEQEREAARNTVALAEVSAVLAHEIRNPLASMELFAGLIAGSPSGATEYVTHLQAGIRTLSATVNNVLRLNSAGHSHFSPISIARAVRDSVEFVRPIAEQSEVEIEFGNESEELQILGDENALRQVLLNLACNAIRHMSGGGRLRVSVRKRTYKTRVHAVVLVADNGQGIRPEHMAYIFDPGFSGTGLTPGLGLTVCKRIVEQHQGRISVFSREHRGTTFRLEFPTL